MAIPTQPSSMSAQAPGVWVGGDVGMGGDVAGTANPADAECMQVLLQCVL